jgi:hypothetical protein
MSIVNFNDLVDQVNDQVKYYLDTMELTTANRLGLDPRAGHELFVGPEGIAVHISDEKPLRYYGGFEYVNEQYHRVQLGDYVFYSNKATRVDECLEFYLSECEYGTP